jgi:hypothetical protein
MNTKLTAIAVVTMVASLSGCGSGGGDDDIGDALSCLASAGLACEQPQGQESPRTGSSSTLNTDYHRFSQEGTEAGVLGAQR